MAGAEPDPGAGANLLFSTGKVAFTAPTYKGSLTSAVYDNDPSNPFGPTGVTFTYLIENAATSAHELHRFTVSSFAGFNTDASYSSTSEGTAPTFVDRNSGVGDVVGFSFPTSIPPVFVTSGPIFPGSNSALMVIQTNAVNFQPTLAAVIDGSTTMVASLAPAPIVPEPSTVVLAGMSAALVFVMSWRRRRR